MQLTSAELSPYNIINDREPLTEQSVVMFDALVLAMETKGRDRAVGVSYRDMSSFTQISILGQDNESVMIARAKEDFSCQVLACSLDHTLEEVLQLVLNKLVALLTTDDFAKLRTAYAEKLKSIEDLRIYDIDSFIGIRNILAYERLLEMEAVGGGHENRLAS